ncbi:unnamed protein product [Boreogadus saida]
MEVPGNFDETEPRGERERLRVRVGVLEEALRCAEVECRASRETLVRLMEELEQERRRAASSTAARQSLQEEVEGLSVVRRSGEQERQSLLECVEAGRRVVAAAGREAQCLQGQVTELDGLLQRSRAEAQASRGQLHRLLETLAKASGSPGVPGAVVAAQEMSEADVVGRVEELCSVQQDAKRVMDTRLSQVSVELGRQAALQGAAEQRAQRAEQQLGDLRARLQDAQADLLAVDAHRDALRNTMQHYEEFLKLLMETMTIDGVDLDLGVDMRLRLIQSRAEQLVKQEGAAVVENKTLAYSLQRKLKQQKERLESKELHTALLRKKVQEMEEQERRSLSALALERDGALGAVRRLHKKVERLQSELNAAKLSSTELGARAAHSTELKLAVLEQRARLQQQSSTLEALVEGKSTAEERLRVLTSDLQGREQRAGENQRQIASLTHSLDQASERERELVDLRMVVSQMLGLDATTQVTVPNHQIIRSLDSFLHPPLPPPHIPHHHHQHPPLTGFWPCPAHPEPHTGLREIQAQRDSTPSGQEANSTDRSSHSGPSNSTDRSSHSGPSNSTTPHSGP